MRYRNLLQFILVTLMAPLAIAAQPADERKPVTKSEVFAALESTRSSEPLIKRINAELIADIEDRGVDFVLTPLEEWQLELRDASDALLAAIRGGIDPEEREYRIKTRRQESLYMQFASNYNGADLASRQAALSAANEFLSLYSGDANVAEIVGFMQKNLPRLQQSVVVLQEREAAAERARTERERRSQQRAERDRRRRDAAVNSKAASNAPKPPAAVPAIPPERSEKKEDTRRQPSDPVNRPLFPIVRRP